MSLLEAPGDLARTPLAAVLLEALNNRVEGVLAVEHDGGTSRLWFRNGRPQGAQVFSGFRPLGHMLLQAGKIDVDTLSRSLSEMAATGRPQGEILVKLGAVTKEDVDEALATQQAGYFAHIAALDAGSFRFDPSQPVPEWTRGSRLSPLRTIVDALERPQAGSLVAGALYPVALCGARLSPAYADVAPGFRWTGPEAALVARLHGPASLEDFFAPLAGVGGERMRAVLAALLLLGLANPASEPADDTAEATAATGLTLEGDQPDRTGATPVPRPLARPTPAPAAAPAPPPAAAPTPAPVAPGRRSDPVEARARRQRLLARAMQNMGVGPLGARGERHQAAGAPAPQQSPPPPAPPTGQPAAPQAPAARAAPRPEPATRPAPAPGRGPPAAAPATEPPRAPPPRPGPPPKPEPPAVTEATLRAGLLELLPQTRQPSLFARLGVPEGATKDVVKKAFLQLARRFHPDRFASPALADMKETVGEFFTAVNEAYEVLTDDRKRADYLATAQPGAQKASHGDTATVDFQKAEACLRTRDYARGRAFLEAAIRADPRAEYKATLAWAFLTDPAGKNLARARVLVAEAWKDERCERARYVAGLLAREEGHDAEAERAFRAALAINPGHAEAQRELRALEARRGPRRG